MAAPTLTLETDQSSSPQPYQPLKVTLGMSRYEISQSGDWTQSPAASNEYYYTGGTASLSANTMFKVRATEGNVKMRSGTLGSLPIYGYAFGDNDSLGYDTIYVRMGDSAAPGDDEVFVYWDESSMGDSNRDAATTVEWFLDLNDATTAASVAAWDADFRDLVDPVTGAIRSKAGSLPTATTGSHMKGWSSMACYGPGTFNLKCRATNGDAEQALGEATITVPADTRPTFTVGSGGDYATLVAAEAAGLAENTQLNLLDGFAETITSTLIFEVDGLRIHALGSATLTIDAKLQNRGKYVTIDGNITINSSLSNQVFLEQFRTNMLGVVGVKLTGTSSAYLESLVKIKNTGLAAGVDENLPGLLIQSCTIDILGEYLIGASIDVGGLLDVHVEGNDILGDLTIFGNGPSTNESPIRDVARSDSQTIIFNKIREMTKDGHRVNEAHHSYIAHNLYQDGTLKLGESGGSADKCYETRIEANRFVRSAATSGAGSITAGKGVDGCYIVSNVLTEGDAGASIAITGANNPGSDTTYYAGYREHRDVFVLQNTIEKTAGGQDTIKGAGSTLATYVTNWNIKGNHVLEFAGYAGSGIVAHAATVANNTEETGSLDSDLYASVTPVGHTTEPGVYLDYFNRVRGTTSTRGATGVASVAARTTSTSVNANLKGINNPRSSDTESIKVLAVGDSQTQPSPIRMWGTLKDLAAWKTNGIAFGLQQNQIIGVALTNNSGSVANVTATQRELEDAMAIDAASGVMSNLGMELVYSGDVANGATIAISQLKGNTTWDGGVLDTDEEIVACVLLRDHATTERIRFRAVRNNVANAPTTDLYGGDFNNDGEFQSIEFVIPSRAAFPGAPGANLDVGVAIESNFGLETGHDNHIANVMYRRNGTAGATDFASTGLTFSAVQQSGWTAAEMLAGLDRGLLRGEIKMQRGLSTVFIMFGHNDAGDSVTAAAHKTAVEGLLDAIDADHDTLGYDRPHYVLITPWAITNSVVSDLIEEYGQKHREISNSRTNVAHVSLYEFYDGQIPDGVLAGADGVFHEFNMGDLVHPSDYDTASYFLEALDWNLQSENFVASDGPGGYLQGSRGSRGLRAIRA